MKKICTFGDVVGAERKKDLIGMSMSKAKVMIKPKFNPKALYPKTIDLERKLLFVIADRGGMRAKEICKVVFGSYDSEKAKFITKTLMSLKVRSRGVVFKEGWGNWFIKEGMLKTLIKMISNPQRRRRKCNDDGQIKIAYKETKVFNTPFGDFRITFELL